MSFFGFQWHITDRCNLRCLHCYQDNFSDSLDDIDRLKLYADKVLGSGLARRMAVNITGGEPLLYPHIETLLRYIHFFDALKEINIITNGTFVNDRLLELIGSLQKIKYIKISLESPDPLTNDRIRGKNNLETVTANLERFKKTGKEILIMMTLASYNAGDVEKMLEFVERYSLSGVIFERFVPLGNGRGLFFEYLKSQEFKEVVKRIITIAHIDIEAEDLVQYRAFWLLRGRRRYILKGALCNLGRSSMALMPDGSVFPCRRYNKKVADLNTNDFEDVLKILSQYEVKNLKKRLKGDKCSLCGFDQCAGCRALVYAFTQDEYGDDFQCFL